MVKDFQDITLRILVFTSCLELQLDIVWLPPHQNVRPDFFSKVVDLGDYSVHMHIDVFRQLDELWGQHTIGRFACHYKTKFLRFTSRFHQPGTEAVEPVD